MYGKTNPYGNIYVTRLLGPQLAWKASFCLWATTLKSGIKVKVAYKKVAPARMTRESAENFYF